MTFKIMAFVMTFAGCVLGLRFILAGASVLKEWGIEATDGPLVICRRLGAVYLGLALMFLLGRTAAPSDLRSAVCLGVGGAIALLACLGLFEFRARRVTSGIIVPAIVEAVLAAGFVWTWWGGRVGPH
jgi:membrane associated rhomboid family serine protease